MMIPILCFSLCRLLAGLPGLEGTNEEEERKESEKGKEKEKGKGINNLYDIFGIYCRWRNRVP